MGISFSTEILLSNGISLFILLFSYVKDLFPLSLLSYSKSNSNDGSIDLFSDFSSPIEFLSILFSNSLSLMFSFELLSDFSTWFWLVVSIIVFCSLFRLAICSFLFLIILFISSFISLEGNKFLLFSFVFLLEFFFVFVRVIFTILLLFPWTGIIFTFLKLLLSVIFILSSFFISWSSELYLRKEKFVKLLIFMDRRLLDLVLIFLFDSTFNL